MAFANSPRYVVIVKDAAGNKVEFDRALNLQWTRYENNAGRLRFTVPWNDPKLSSTSLPTDKFSQVYVYRNESLVWQGFLGYITDSKFGTDIFGLDWKEVLKWYGVGYNVSYTNANIGTGIVGVIYDNIVARTNNILNAFITKGTIEDPYTTGSSSVARTLSRTTFDQNYFTFLQDMLAAATADSPNGSWVQNTVFDISLSETTPTFSFLRNVGVDQPDAVFELDSEIIDFSIQTDLHSISNKVTGYCIQAGPLVLTDAETDSTSQTNYYLRENAPYFGTVTTQAELTDRTQHSLKVLKDPQQYLSVQFTQGLIPFNGYSMGDNVNIKINRGRVNTTQYYRVVGMEVSIDNTGTEKVNPRLRKKRT